METYSNNRKTAEVTKNAREWTVVFREEGRPFGGFVKDYKTKREAVAVAKFLVSDEVKPQ